MLDIREIEYWISRYENEADKLDQMPTLSALYSIRDRLRGDVQSTSQQQAVAYSEAAAPVSEPLNQYGDSDFLRTVAGKDPATVWPVMDELMETLQVINVRLYESAMWKLGKL